jgi:hypothetical protein
MMAVPKPLHDQALHLHTLGLKRRRLLVPGTPGGTCTNQRIRQEDHPA